ncbi:MAG: DUF3800 domain-containing protein [Candidatus Acidiferrales bacterium]
MAQCDTLGTRSYTPLEHLVLSVFPGDGGDGIMAFTLYFDDSGTHDQSSTAVAACFVATVNQWKELERKWSKVGAEEGFSRFHMADFAATPPRREFAGWSDEKRRRVLDRLLVIIDAHVYSGFSFGVVKRDYDDIVPESLKRTHFGAFHYTFALRSCIGSMGTWRKIYFPKVPLTYVFDQLPPGKTHEIVSVMDAAIEQAKRERAETGSSAFDGYSFASSATMVPLQAADIFAWTTFQGTQVLVSHRKPNWVAEMAFERMHRLSAKISMSIHKREQLRRWVEVETKELIKRLESSTL